MKILTAAQMREVDRRTIEMGIPGIVLMENAGSRVVEFLIEKYAPLERQRIAILCGKGNNGGDGMVIARQLYTRFKPAAMWVALLCDTAELKGDAALNWHMLQACGCPVLDAVTPEMRTATIVVDALLGTGLQGPARGPITEAIHAVNNDFPLAEVVAVDLPSGMMSDSGAAAGECVRAKFTVTFTAPKISQILPPNCEQVGELRVCPIGSPSWLYEDDAAIYLSLNRRVRFRRLLAPRERTGHKGTYGHVLVVAGSHGKTGAAAMAGTAALRAGAGLVTVASASSALPVISGHAAELMTEEIPVDGDLRALAEKRDVVAIGPGLGTGSHAVETVRRAMAELKQHMVIDADGLNALAGSEWKGDDRVRVLTPHPGEMSRLTDMPIRDIEADRIGAARALAMARNVTVVLKGYRTAIAHGDGEVWVNPTGTPALATAGTGDILTGLIAGFLAQFPDDVKVAVAAAVYLHGLSGELGARELGEKALVATDLLRYLPAAMEACAHLPDNI